MSDWPTLAAQTLTALAALLALPGSVVLARWTWAARHPAAVLPAQSCSDHITLLVPAHNEAAALPHTLPGLMAAAAADGHCQLVLIADNCSDATAALARQCGATVLERHDDARRGKGHALEYAIASLPPSDWYLVIDADTRLDTNYLPQLRRVLASQPAGVQTRYVPHTVEGDWQAPLRHWAMQGFNTLRPRARARLGEPVGILGNGFALSARTLQRVPYVAGSIVEDLEYQLALTRAGLKLAWCEQAVLYGEMPGGAGASIQRCRWEGGRLALLRQQGLGLLRQWLGGAAGARHALEELLLLPLSQHLLLLLAGVWAPLPFAVLSLLGLAVLAAHAGQALVALPMPQRLAALRGLPRYLLWKLARLPGIVRQSRRNAAWQRSTRQAEMARHP